MLGGYPPFIEQNQRELFRKIRKGEYEFHEEYWGQVSKDAKHKADGTDMGFKPVQVLSAAETSMPVSGECKMERPAGL